MKSDFLTVTILMRYIAYVLEYEVFLRKKLIKVSAPYFKASGISQFGSKYCLAA